VVDRGQIVSESRALTPQERLEDALFTGLRLSSGVDLDAMKSRYDVDVWTMYGQELERFAEAGLLIYDGARMRLTRAGMLLAHEVMAVFISPSVR
jgi:oxygen-independent coproporphyrinogen-3 oxidase